MRRLLAVALLASLVVVPAALATAPIARPAYSGGSFAGEGFDKCEAPSSSALRSWLASPYKAVNIYMGGNNRACADQPELSPQWLSTVTQNGWSIIPTYVGSQAGCTTSSKTNKIVASTAAAQGTAEADDAAAGMAALGLPPAANNPVYFDMEPYHLGSSYTTCDNAVLTFLAAWTTELHLKGYLAGVYGTVSPTNGAVYALYKRSTTDPTYQLPDAIWYARWDGNDASTGDPDIPDTFLAGHRIHQYRGGHSETFNANTFNIDNDRIDGDVVGAVTPTPPTGPAPYHYAAAPPAGTTLKERSAPSATAPQTTAYPSGTDLPIVCQTTGDAVQGDSVWDQLSDGNFVSDIFTTTTGGLSFTNGIPQCGGTTTADTTPPTATMTPLDAATIATSQTVSWTGTDDSSGVASYDVQWRRASWNGSFDAWQQPARWTATTSTSGTLGLSTGYDYCLRVRATDVAGNVGAWSSSTCIARPLDDRSLSANAPWTRTTGGKFYFNTATQAQTKGVTVKLPNARLAQVGIVATVCSTCGKVEIFAGARSLGVIRLQSPQFRNRVILMSPQAVSRRTRTITILTRSRGLVRIDGIAVLQTAATAPA